MEFNLIGVVNTVVSISPAGGPPDVTVGIKPNIENSDPGNIQPSSILLHVESIITLQTVIEPSCLHSDEQPSPSILLPSSHSSSPWTVPSPHISSS